MLLPKALNSVNPLLKETYIDALLKINQETEEYGLVLSPEEIKNIIEVRNKVLDAYGRVELGLEVTKKLIMNFYTSAFINDENYVPTLNELHEIFYYLKNETEDRISDDKLIEIIKNKFENSCEGSIDLLKSTLEVFAEDFRRNAQKKNYINEGCE